MVGDSTFGLTIHLTEREHSRDFHTNTYDVEVDGTRVRYEGPYGEGTRGMYDTDTAEFHLSEDQQREIRRILATYDLQQSVSESVETEDVDGPFLDVDAEATIQVDGETYDLEISGVWNVDGRETNMVHHEQVRGLISLCWTFKGWAEESSAW